MVFIIDAGDALGKDWVNSPNTYPIEEYGVMRPLPDGDLLIKDASLYKILGLLIESRDSVVMVLVYKTDMEGDLFKYVVKPNERRWVIFPSFWKVKVMKMASGARSAVYDIWAEK